VIGKTTNSSGKEWSANSELRVGLRMRSYDSRAGALRLFGAIQHLRFPGFATRPEGSEGVSPGYHSFSDFTFRPYAAVCSKR